MPPSVAPIRTVTPCGLPSGADDEHPAALGRRRCRALRRSASRSSSKPRFCSGRENAADRAFRVPDVRRGSARAGRWRRRRPRHWPSSAWRISATSASISFDCADERSSSFLIASMNSALLLPPCGGRCGSRLPPAGHRARSARLPACRSRAADRPAASATPHSECARHRRGDRSRPADWRSCPAAIRGADSSIEMMVV